MLITGFLTLIKNLCVCFGGVPVRIGDTLVRIGSTSKHAKVRLFTYKIK